MSVDENILGGGSGGGDDDDTHKSALGSYEISANRVVLVTKIPLDPMATLDPNGITILAGGNTFIDGKVDIRGSKGVRITSGPPAIPMLSPETTSDSTDGVEIIASEAQNVTIQRGLIPDVDQVIQMQPGSIMVDGGVGTVTIQSLTEITLQVAGGLSKITLTPAGIIMEGPIIMIN
jgi:hypothetical protein